MATAGRSILGMEAKMKWRRDDFGTYADSPTEDTRYYVRREGTRWTVEAVPTVTTAGVRTVKPGTNPRWVDRFNPTMRLAKAIAEAYDNEPERVADKATNRLTRALAWAYEME